MPFRFFKTGTIKDFFRSQKKNLSEAQPGMALFGMAMVIVSIFSFILVLDIVMVIVRSIAALTI